MLVYESEKRKKKQRIRDENSHYKVPIKSAKTNDVVNEIKG